MRRMKLPVILAVLGISTASCYYDNEAILYGEEVCSPEAPGYQLTIAPIISRNCLECHDAATASGGVVLETYEQVKQHASSGNLVGVVSHVGGFTPMPKDRPQLPSCNVEAITRWVTEGSQNN